MGLILVAFAAPAWAQQDEGETPAFDRPGLGFAASVLPAGGVALELGLPDYERDRDDAGTRTTQYGTDLRLRVGLGANLELQAFGSPWNRLREAPRNAPSNTTRGAGDSGLALKFALPLDSDRHAVALLASSSFDTGSRDFSEGGTQYQLGASYEYTFNDRWTGALYANATRGAGEDAFEWSPSLSLAVSVNVSAFIEAGFTHTDGEPSTSVAGAGLTWMPARRVQLDASFDLGLDRNSPDLQAGLGVSFYFE
ncbi:transporter [uncultured Stenotrophomonas sp.]|uniref:transporter n=1 Tax=uncultured Stenotrophomonas sp. TaxID=165438 RepID=UPI0028F170CD|nr:transporter [uncultured Stenotrophomonas sp.]